MGWGRAPHEGVPKIGARPQPMLSSLVDRRTLKGHFESRDLSNGPIYLRSQKPKSPRQRAFCIGKDVDQPKFFSANDQFTSLSRKVSTNLGRMLR
jgi:hypothetical protein